MKLLVHDNQFPGKWGRWRLQLMGALSQKYDTDFLSLSLGGATIGTAKHTRSQLPNNTVGCMQEVDKYVPIKNYNYYVFHPNYQEFIDFGGRSYYDTLPCSLLMKQKSQNKSGRITSKDTNWAEEYDVILHTFYNHFIQFNKAFEGVPYEKQVLILYPGGGFTSFAQLSNIPPEVKIVCTQSFVSEVVSKLPNQRVDIYPGFIRGLDEKPRLKNKNGGKLRACFAFVGDPEKKGWIEYGKLAKVYKQAYGANDVEFYCVSPHAKSWASWGAGGVTHILPLESSKFDNFLHERIDIIFDLQRNIPLPHYGWPHGLEGALQGAVLFAKDPHDLNRKNKFNFGEELFVVSEPFNPEPIVEEIRKLYLDRDLLLQRSREIQRKTFEILSDENTYQKLFDFLEK